MRFGESVWVCKKLDTPAQDGNTYSAPIEIKTCPMYFTVMNKSGYYDIQEFGENIKKYLTAIAQPYQRWFDEFHNGDLFYCDGNEPSESENWYGEKANYIVDNVDNGNQVIKITLKKVVD